MALKKINFKQPKYILPAIAFPFVLLIGYIGNNFSKSVAKTPKDELTKRETISTGLGDVNNVDIKGKQDAYREFYDKRTDGRTMIGGFDTEQESLAMYDDNLTFDEKRYIDSLNYAKDRERLMGMGKKAQKEQEYYSQQERQRDMERQRREDEEYERSMKMIEMLSGNKNQNQRNNTAIQEDRKPEPSFKDEQLSLMREQMMMMDSLEKANNPELRAQAEAQHLLKKNQEELEFFLNSTLKVSKASKNANFNSIYKQKESSFIKAVIDENVKGYLGSRIRIRLLEDIYVGNIKIEKGTVLYALISGFSLQRVNLNIVSIMYQNEILPINLNIYDVDGMEGLYVPQSVFREMSRTMAQNTVQGQSLTMANSDFFSNALTSMFQSTSKSIADLIRKNKVKVKYNSFVYLIDNKELQKKKQNIYKSNTNNR
ncbi:conjugative transposon protein TraM [Sphingobacterium faecium]|uniref:conjugative transposon protein TraM n=1 Tax=Sphingobacterium faecium TaxID=34087 RepID=UPI002468B509|nr:conjugative transposon protein TraM [Sphingobacterium faecium]MDH5828858.1 conjugative transposon protein TraM [Sphingobacterium faecium]WGQ17055.1 conjugative transposon protein TraM [Sphingobacterium faecium]